jgi:hypothetical protein
MVHIISKFMKEAVSVTGTMYVNEKPVSWGVT